MITEKFSIIRPGLVLGFMLGAMIFLSAGCSENDEEKAENKQNVANVTHSTKEQIVSERALARQNALIEQDFAAAYKYFSPARRSVYSLDVFSDKMLRGVVLRTSAEVKKVVCDQDVCDVSIGLTYRYRGKIVAMQGKETSSMLHEKWVFTDGAWWFSPNKTL